MTIAKAIDTALAEGSLGVSRHKVLKVPRILAVNTPMKMTARAKVEAQVRALLEKNVDFPERSDAEQMLRRLEGTRVP